MSQKTLAFYHAENIAEHIEKLRNIDYADDSLKAIDLAKLNDRISTLVTNLGKIDARVSSMYDQRVANPNDSYGRS